jgi:hypothetical protein
VRQPSSLTVSCCAGGELTCIERLAVHGVIVPQVRLSRAAPGAPLVPEAFRLTTGGCGVGQGQGCPGGHRKGRLARQEEPGLRARSCTAQDGRMARILSKSSLRCAVVARHVRLPP